MKQILISLLAMVSVVAVAANRVSLYDTNKDGGVDYTELSVKCKVSQQLFSNADKNGDGVLNEAEMRTAKSYLFGNCKK